MPADSVVLLAVLFLLIGGLYASVGHAGASGYLAVMALAGVAPESMRSTALAVNVVVASIAFAHYAAAGHFSWRFLVPFAVASIPAAFLGAAIDLPTAWLQIAIGAALAIAAIRMFTANLAATSRSSPPHDPSVATKILAGAAIGFAAGVTGTGGGIFLSPLILICGWAEPKRTAATASLFILLNSIAGLSGLVAIGWTPTLDLAPLVIAAATGGAVGAAVGSRRASPRVLNLLLAAVLAIAAAKLLLAGAGNLTSPPGGSADAVELGPLPDGDIALHPLDERGQCGEALGSVPRAHHAAERDLARADASTAVHHLDRADPRPLGLFASDRLEHPARHGLVDLVVDRGDRTPVLLAANDSLEADSAADLLVRVETVVSPVRAGCDRPFDQRDLNPHHPPPTMAINAISSPPTMVACGSAKVWLTASRPPPTTAASAGCCRGIASSTAAAVVGSPSHSTATRSAPIAAAAGPKRSTSTRMASV